mgnify:CR=1 FL=1
MCIDETGTTTAARGQETNWAVQATPHADPLLSRVYVEPTSRCNLQCRTCIRNVWNEPTGDMSMATYLRLVDGLRAVPTLKRMSFWGYGEPLLHPHIVEMIRLAGQLGAQTDIVTNGVLLTGAMAERLIEAGLDTIVVSIDGTSAEGYGEVRTGGDLQLVLDNMRELLAVRRAYPAHRLEIGLEFVATRRNIHELGNLRQLARSVGASFVVVSNVLPHTEEMSSQTLYGLWAGTSFPDRGSSWNPQLVISRMDARPEVVEGLARLLEFNGAVGDPPGGRQGVYSYCKFVCEGSIVVGWDGGLSPCVALMHSYPCYIMGRKKDIKRYTLGNVNQEDVTDVWQKEEFRRFRKLVQEFDFPPCTTCACELAESNEEDCYGNTFPVCGDCLWAKGVLQCP